MRRLTMLLVRTLALRGGCGPPGHDPTIAAMRRPRRYLVANAAAVAALAATVVACAQAEAGPGDLAFELRRVDVGGPSSAVLVLVGLPHLIGRDALRHATPTPERIARAE